MDADEKTTVKIDDETMGCEDLDNSKEDEPHRDETLKRCDALVDKLQESAEKPKPKDKPKVLKPLTKQEMSRMHIMCRFSYGTMDDCERFKYKKAKKAKETKKPEEATKTEATKPQDTIDWIDGNDVETEKKGGLGEVAEENTRLDPNSAET
ncbi:hypothetical protein HRG_002810 [Hirsutella rhossiliensis]|uniref:Uncharacterized protein n=1 Tax=Hirsutella rhossiliensis TaxID=111463 RepID=A0A9P8N0W3_9HYPO|nr:uncharacterized protein HRG_02810 [Hirsutella rhossiliensis]KAH0964794.1 hypothetical protein HRG_02810 [Hirsutella rhossiliensis]